MKKTAFIRDKAFYKKVLAIMIPVAAQQAINMGVNMMDTIMLGRYGEIQLSASSLANSFYSIYQILCMGTIGGCSVLAAQFWGAKEKDRVKEVFNLALRISGSLGIIFALVTWFFPAPIMRLFSEDPAVIEAGVRYLKITTFIYLIHGTGLVTAQLMRTVGNARLGLYVSIISFSVNIFANWVFIFGKLGMPEMQIAGAALGTLIARAAEFIVTFWFVLKKDTQLKLKLRDYLINPSVEVIKKYLKMGLPALLSDGLLSLGNTVMAMIIGRMGTAVAASNSVCQVVDRMVTVIFNGISNASGIIVGNTIGAGKKEEAQAEGETFYVLALIFGAIAAVIIALIGPVSLKLYDLEPDTVVIAKQMMRSFIVIIFFQSIQSVMTKGVLRGGGDTKFLLAADILFLWIASIPLGYLTGLLWDLPAWVAMCALRVDFAIKSFWCIGRLKSGKWIHEVSFRKKQA